MGESGAPKQVAHADAIPGMASARPVANPAIVFMLLMTTSYES
jgi:hypothetical protein